MGALPRNSIAVHENFIAIYPSYLILPVSYLGDAEMHLHDGRTVTTTFHALINAIRASKLTRAQYNLSRLLCSHARLNAYATIPFIWSRLDRLTRNVCKLSAPHRATTIAIFWDHPAIAISHWIIAALCTEDKVYAISTSWYDRLAYVFKSNIPWGELTEYYILIYK